MMKEKAVPASRHFWRRRVAPYVFISPFFILFFIFGLFPILFSLWLSFHRWDVISPMEWVGLENYMYLLKDDWFWQSISNTIKLGLMSSIPQHILALILAFILNSQLVKFSKVYRTAYFMPYITSTVAVALVFQIIFGTRYGVMNYLLTPLRDYNWFQQLLTWLDLTFPIEWLGRVHTIKPTLAMLTIWRWTGWNMVLYLAGLQSIPHEIYESAKVDGASNWDLFWRISLPLLRPMMTFAVTMSVIGSMQAFDEPMVILGTGGGVGRAGKTTVLYLYQTSFEWMDFGTGAAMSYLLFFLIIVFSVINFRFFRRKR